MQSTRLTEEPEKGLEALERSDAAARERKRLRATLGWAVGAAAWLCLLVGTILFRPMLDPSQLPGFDGIFGFALQVPVTVALVAYFMWGPPSPEAAKQRTPMRHVRADERYVGVAYGFDGLELGRLRAWDHGPARSEGGCLVFEGDAPGFRLPWPRVVALRMAGPEGSDDLRSSRVYVDYVGPDGEKRTLALELLSAQDGQVVVSDARELTEWLESLRQSASSVEPERAVWPTELSRREFDRRLNPLDWHWTEFVVPGIVALAIACALFDVWASHPVLSEFPWPLLTNTLLTPVPWVAYAAWRRIRHRRRGRRLPATEVGGGA